MITYGNTGSGGAGATAPSSSGAQTWQAQEKSTSASSLANLGSSPSVTVLAADGSGTLTTPTGTVNSAATGRTITFTYTAATGGISNGSVTALVPAGWSAPSTTGSNAGYTTSSSGTVSVAGQTITVSSLTLSGGSTFTITYGDTGSGGPGATAPVPAGGQTWQAQEKSSSGGTLMNLAASPSITVNDPTPPSAPGLSFGSFTSASATGTTVYIRQGTAGGFTVTGTSSDTESGIDHLTFASGLGTGWAGGGADSSSPYAGAYTFNSSATAPAGSQDVTATNGWALTSSSTPFTVVADTTAPAVTAPTLTAGYYTALSVAVTKNGGTDGGSGVDNTSSTVQRDEVGLTNGSCGTFPSSWSSVTLVGGNDTTVVSGNCYRYRELLSDNVGNQGTSAASNTAKVDTTAPSTPSLAFGALSPNAYYDGSGTLYVRPSAGGTFTVTATSTDAQSAVGSYTFGALNSNGGANFGGSQAGDHFDYTFGATTTAPSTARTVSSTNGAGTGSANATYSIAADTTAPSVTAPSVTAGYYTSNTVSVTKNGGSDGGSNVDASTSTLERDTATLTSGACGSFPGSWSTVTLAAGNDATVTNGHCYEYRELLSDHVGNQGTSGASNVAKVDSQGPANSIALSNVSPAGSALKNGSTVYYRGSAAGSFKLTNGVTDGESGPASSASAALGGTTGGWSHTPSTVSTPSTGPYDSNTFGWSAGSASTPTEVLTAADQAGNLTSSATLTFANDSNAPTGGALTVNGTTATGGGSSSYSASGSFPIDVRTDYIETQSSSESGLASSTLTRESATLTANSCGSFGSASTITGTPAQSLPTGCYLYTLTGTDNLGNTGSITSIVKVDTSSPSAPSLTLSNPSGGLYVSGTNAWFKPTSGGSFDLGAASSDGDTGIASYTFPSAGAMGASWSASGSGASRTYSFSSGAAEPGTKSVDAANGAGSSSSSNFTVSADSTAPTTTIQCNAAACFSGTYYASAPVHVTLSADDGSGSGVEKIRYTTDGTNPSPINGSDYSGTIDVASTTTIKFRAYDNLGNEEAVGSTDVLLDGTPPNLSLTLAENPASGTQYVSGTTLFYRPGAAGGTFRVTAITDDPQTGVTSVDFPSVATVTGGSSQTSSPYREDYTWSAATTDATGHNVVATNGASAATSVPFTLTQDSAAPTGPSITLTGATAPYFGSASVTFSLGDGNDGAGSGIDTTTRTVTRESATLTGDACGTFSADAGTYTSPDTAVSTGHCYRYSFTIADRVGNVSSATTATAKVDTAAPAVSINAPSALTGAGNQYYDAGTKTLFFRSTGAGSFSLGANVSDTNTAIAGVTFPNVSGLTGWTGSTGGTDTSSPYSSPTDYTWSSGAAEPGAKTVSASDEAANSSSDTITIADDTSAPTGQSITLTGALAPYYGSNSVGFNLADGSDNGGGAGLDLASATVTRETGTLSADSCSGFSADAGTFTSPDTSVSNGHCYRYTFRIADKVANLSAPVTTTAKVDTDNPTVSLTDPGTPVAGTIALSATASDPSTDIQQVVFERVPAGGSTWTPIGTDTTSPYTTSWDTTAVSDGQYDVRAVATDKANNTNTSFVASRRVDNAAPTTTIDAMPTDPSNDTTPTFSFSSSETGSTFECRVDGAGWAACSNPETLGALGAGSHTFDVRATDAAGNTDATPASYTWAIDLTAPDTTIDAQPADPSSDTTPTFAFSSSEPGSTFECRIDSGSWTSCSSPDSLSPALTEGSHTFDVRAIDEALNTDTTPASDTWIIDSGAPSVTLTAPLTYLNGSDPNNYVVTATTSDTDVAQVDFYECSNASASCATGSWLQFGTDSSAPYAATWSTPAFDGLKSIRAVAVDAATNTGEDIRDITIDRTAPTGVTVGYPNGYVTGSYAVIINNGSDPDVNGSTGSLERRTGDLASNACSSYSGWAAATSPDTLASGKCAQYRYSVADNAGNVALAAPANEVKSDTTAPTATLTDPGANLRQAITLSAGASDTDGSGVNSVAFERRPAGGGSWTTIAADGSFPYSISFDTTTVADGLYDFRSVATDVAGNVETSPSVVANRRIDNTAPSATMFSPGDPVGGAVSLTSNTGDTGGSGIATVSYELAPNGGSFNSQPASWDTTLLSDGLYDLRVVATDVAGNTKTSPAVTTRVDNTPPALNFTSPATGSVVTGAVSLVGSATDASPASPPITFAYKLHSDPPSAYAATGSSWNTVSLPAGDGLYDLRATATDDAANTTNVENTNIRVDNAPPTVAITAPATAINGSLPSPTTFAANASDPAGSGISQVEFFECTDQSNDCSSGVWSPLGTVPAPGPYSVSWAIPAADGNHALAAVATDNAGHTATAIRNVDVDRTAPNTSIVTKPADPSNGTPSFTFTSTESGSTFECGIDGGGFAPCTSPHTVLGLTDNSHTFQVRATDAAGNTDATPDSWTWHRDTNAPNATLNNPGNNVRQIVTLTSVENDPPANGYQSGVASVAFEYSANGTTWASVGTNTSPPFDNILWNTALVADGLYQLRIIVSDAAGNSTTDVLGSTIRIDNTPPTTSQNDPGQYLRGTKTLSGSAGDAGSGIDHVDFERAPTGGGSWTIIATDSTPGDGFQASFDTTSVSDGHYDFRTVAYDVAGNQAAATPVSDRLVDNTPPDATISSPGAYLRGAVNLTSSTSDPGGSNASGIVTVAYEYSTNGGSTWQSTGSNFNSSAVPDGNVDLRVVATDAAGNLTASAPATSFVDNTKPSTTDNAPSGWQSTPVTVTLNPNDGGSGVNVTEYSVDGNPSYTVGTSVVIPAPADGSNDGSHTIAYFSVDNAGNIETIKSTTVLIDATPPTCAACSAADYLRGTVDLSADPDTTGSGIKAVTFEYTDAGGSTWTTIGSDTTGPGPYAASWDTTPVPDGQYDLRILITDNADNITTTDLPDKVVDNTAPDVAIVGAPTEGQLVSGTVGIAASASDATSPVASVKFYVGGSLLGTDSTAPFSLNWNTMTGADGGATIQVVVADMAGNTTTSAVRNVSVDNVSPTPTLADPGQYLNGSVSLSASSDPDTTQVDFERRTAGGGSWVTIASDTTAPWGTSLDTTALADGLYDFRAIATDATGHTGTSPIRANVRVDNTSPAGSLTSPAGGATVGGPSVTLSGSYSDAGSGVASVRYELRPTGGGSWTAIATSTSAPFSATWDATTVVSGSYDLQPVLSDRAGNTFTGALRTITVDVSAPTVVLANPGATISGSVTLNATVTGSGATQVSFATSPAGGASWSSVGTDTSAPWSTTFNTSLLPDGVYDIRATVSDSLGNTSFDTVTSIRVDNAAPRVVSSTPAEGSTVSSANAIGLVTSEPATPLNVTLDGGATVAPVVSGTHIDFGTGTLSVGAHTLSGEVQDSSGKRAPFRVHFTVWSASGSSLAPPVNKNTSSATSTTVESADGFAAATMSAGAWSTSGADWLILRITPVAAPSGLTNGFGSGPEALDVTARWALAGTEVHQFNRPIGILMRTTEKGLVPATFENSQWRVIARVPSAGTLPAGWDDGFWTDGAGFHLLTRHLSVFALLHDLQPPNAPQNVRGYLGPMGLTLRWTPGSDNSGTYDFVTVFSDSTDTGHYGVDYTTASIGSWSVGDPRIFRLKETDLAGNESQLTRPLRPVPSLIGKTPDQVAALLAPLGLSVGSITYGGTGPAGTVTGPANLVLAEEGGSIDLIVSQGGAGTRLAFKVVTAPKIKPAKRRSIGARVTVTRGSRLTAELFSPRRVKLYTWRFSVKAGRTIVKLRLPRQVRRTGVYTMRWTARSGRETVARKLTIRLVRTRARSTQPVQVLLAGGAATSIRGSFTLRKGRVVSSASIEPTFDAAANRRTDVHVIVVDVDQFGVGLISDLHAVFPSAKLVALTSSPKLMVNSLRAGASIAFPRSTPAPTLVRVIQRLLGSPAKPVRSKPAKRHTVGGSR
jgi:hypothetical protein